ncbi:hypothetical protein BZG01_14840 [Labilibaculum manganireducens]|uniref:ABM domain-containing protein n=1 Tax=Labilibaculum manganireducens TaxID=1940525 RepID=A0A2N3I1G4_9BACT|nr:putative quinol monooxygenase [Labilibaculum manganireducens]PKQ64152.1 hypothetical protein BZG01_14840 [Labilibaculum manganireducens]
MKKVVAAKLHIKKEAEKNFLELAEKLVVQTRKEEGCHSYNLYRDCFSTELKFIFYEEYKDESALSAHNSSEYLKKFFKEVTPLLAVDPIINYF